MDIKGKKIIRDFFNFPGVGAEYLEKQKEWRRLKEQQ